MKSGLEGRNNTQDGILFVGAEEVSMKSGLEGRNNRFPAGPPPPPSTTVSTKSGLEGRNNRGKITKRTGKGCLNEVRPRRPEQFSHSMLEDLMNYRSQ